MPSLDYKLAARLDLRKDVLGTSPNVADFLSEEDLAHIGGCVLQDYKDDLQSRTGWEASYKVAMELAMQVVKKKTFPWPGASNVKFPLLTVAALNFHAKAYPAIVAGTNVVKCKVEGLNKGVEQVQRAIRIEQHMSYQLLEETDWEAQLDTGLLVLAILGTIFKKTIQVGKKPCSDLVMPQDLVVNYFAKDVNASRVTHLFELWDNELYTKYEREEYLKPSSAQETDQPDTGPIQNVKDETQGMLPPPPGRGPVKLAEQQTWLDLDGDGYAEPYFVTFHRDTGFVYNIMPRFLPSGIEESKGRVVEIKAESYYTKFVLIPAPDGGFYGMGLGLLLGPLNASVDTLINQLLDAGTMSVLGGGFLGRGARFKYGQTQLKPFEWVNVDSTGDDLRQSVFPLPVREPSAVLFQLLSYLVGYGERVGGSGDLQVGEIPGDNTKAEVARIANENGRLIFNAIFKRIWRDMKDEFKLVYRLNQLHVGATGEDYCAKLFGVTQADYEGPNNGICPYADPNIVSQTQRQQTAQLVLQNAMAQPGMYNLYEANHRVCEAFQVDAIDSVLPKPGTEEHKAIQPGPSEKMIDLQIKQKLADIKLMEVQAGVQESIMRLQMDFAESQARIIQLQADAQKKIAEAGGVDADNITNLMNVQVQAEKNKMEGLKSQMDMLKTVLEIAKVKEETKKAAVEAKAPTTAS